jgi:hypothetical protein
MTDKEKLLKIIEISPDSFESIVLSYITHNIKDFDASRLFNLANDISQIMKSLIEYLEYAKDIAWERALYIQSYLRGGMYTTEEAAQAHKHIHISHAEKIMEVCGRNVPEDI